MAERTTVAAADEVEPGTGTVVDVDGESVALFNVDGRFYAIGNACTHMGGSLGDGRLSDTMVTCPLHGARFDVTSGEVLGPPAIDPVTRYDVEVEDGDVVILR